MRNSSLIVSVLGLAVVSMLSGCAGVDGLYTGAKNGIGQLASLVENKDRTASELAAKDSTDQVAKEMVTQDSKMYWGPNYGNTWFSASDFKERQELVEKRAKTSLADRAPLNQEIKDISDQIVTNERTKFMAKRSKLEEAKKTNLDDAEAMDAQIAWIDSRLAELNRVPGQFVADKFDVAAIAKGEVKNTLASK